MPDRLMDSWRVRPLKHLKQAMYPDQRTDLTQVIGKAASFRKVALVTLLQLWVGEIHNGAGRYFWFHPG